MINVNRKIVSKMKIFRCGIKWVPGMFSRNLHSDKKKLPHSKSRQKDEFTFGEEKLSAG
jgi:hypothetical protein